MNENQRKKFPRMVLFTYFIIITLIFTSINIFELPIKSNQTIINIREINHSKEKFNPNDEGVFLRYFNTPLWMRGQLIGSAISSPTIADLNNDGKLESIIITSNNIIYILDYQGKFLPGWGEPSIMGVDEDLTTGLGLSPHPLTLDLNNDGQLEIICATYNPGTIQAWFLNTSIVPGWPIEIGARISGSPAAGDIDGDGENEIVIGVWDNKVYAFNLNGSQVSGFPFMGSEDEILGSAVLGNLDNDTALEIVFGSYDYKIYALKGNGTLLPGWPKTTLNHVRASPAIVDLDNDQQNEIIIGSWDKNIYILCNNGSNYKNWPMNTTSPVLTCASITDLNSDGYYDFLIEPNNTTLLAFTNAKQSKEYSWNLTLPESISGDIIIADLDGDLESEIILVTTFGNIIILSANGTILLNKELTEKGVDSAPAIGDIDNDGVNELILATLGEGVLRKLSDVYCFKLESFGIIPYPGYRGGKERMGMPFDQDNDKLSDLEEEMVGSNPLDNDTDGDGISDGLEVYKYQLNPTIVDKDADYDNDNLSNVDEVDIYNTNPIYNDTDGDSLIDGDEIFIYNTNPLKSDTDNDLLPDDFEVKYENTNPLVADTYEDLDEDDLSNIEEYNHETNPDLPDTDNDTLLDGDEIKKYYTDPLIPDKDKDSDGDGLTNVEEIDVYGTNPINDDSDGDGYPDGFEIQRGSDPLNSNSIPFPLWSLIPIIGCAIVIIGVVGYFIGKRIYLKRRGEI